MTAPTSSGRPGDVQRPVFELLDYLAVSIAEHLVPPPAHESASPWLTVQDAARRLGYECPGGRAPGVIYRLASEIGKRLGNRWLIHVDDLDQAVRGGVAQ